MKKSSVIAWLTGACAAVAAVAAIGVMISTQSKPRNATEVQFSPDSAAEQKHDAEPLNAAAPPEEPPAAPNGEPLALYPDANTALYCYDAQGKLIGLTKLSDQSEDSLPELDEAALREYAQLYLEGLVAQPERYTLEEFTQENGTWTAHWSADCCGYKTTDIVSVTLNPTGTLQDYHTQQIGKFANVIVTQAQIEDAIARAVAQVDGEDVNITKVSGADEVVLTYDGYGTLVLNVGISAETTGDTPLHIADIYQAPIL